MGHVGTGGACLLNYATLRAIHVTAVALSGSGFLARGAGAARGAAWVRSRVARTLPHLIDTVLLLSALGMLWVVHLSPWALGWLRAKIIGLVCYIGLGVVALRGLRGCASGSAQVQRWAPRRAVALGAWVAALVVFVYIVSVAITKDPRGLFAPLIMRLQL
ncbi:MAG: SirB2 family protein [Solirubrobacteraceae bacterium]